METNNQPMQKNYQEAADQLQQAVAAAVTTLRKQLTDNGLNLDQIPKQPMAVEIASFVLAKCLTDERLVFNPVDEKQRAYQESLEIVKAAVIQYRGANLMPQQIH